MHIFDYPSLHLSVRDCNLLFKKRNMAGARGVLAALKRNNATSLQEHGVEALLGKAHAVASPIGSNVLLRDYGRVRMGCALKRFMHRDTSISASVRIYELPAQKRDEQDWDLKVARKSIRPILKKMKEHSIACVRPAVVDRKPRVLLTVLAWEADRAGGMASPQRRSTPAKAEQSVQSVMAVTGLKSPEEIAAAVAMLWDFNPQPELGPHGIGAGGAARVKNKHHQLDLRCFLVQARLLLTKSMFGIGDGDTIVRSVTRELAARAASLDIAGTSPLQPQAIEAFLATLPGNAGGTPLAMPTLNLL